MRKLCCGGAVQLNDVLLDHLGIHLRQREHVFSADVEKGTNVWAVGQAEREKMTDDEDLDEHQNHHPAGVGAILHRRFVGVDAGGAYSLALVRLCSLVRCDACRTDERADRTAEHATILN